MKYHFFKNAPDWALDQMAQEIAEFQNIMKSWGYVSFINFGTLIGAARNGDFVPGDHDVDICYLSNESDREKVYNEYLGLLEILSVKKMLIRGFERGHCSVRFSQETAIDLFTAYIDGDGDLWTQWGNMGNATDFFPVETMNLRGVPVSVPKNHNALLSQLYGTDWMAPKEEHPSKYLKRKNYLE